MCKHKQKHVSAEHPKGEYNCNITLIENTIAYISQAEHSTLKGVGESNRLCKHKQKHVPAEHPKGEYNCNIKLIENTIAYISQAEHSTLKGVGESNRLCKHKQKHIPAKHLKGDLTRKLVWRGTVANNPLGGCCPLAPMPNHNISKDSNPIIKPHLTPNYNGVKETLRNLSNCHPTCTGRDGRRT